MNALTRTAAPTALAALAFAGLAAAQLPAGLPVAPQNYALTHLFGAPGSTTIESLAMGGAYVADTGSAWSSNPAGALANTGSAFLASSMSASFATLPTFHSSLFSYVGPLGHSNRAAIKIAFTPVRASGALAGTPIQASLSENDPGLEFSYRAGRRLWTGVGMSYLQTSSDYSIPGLGIVTHLESRPSGPGGRLGAIYQCGRKLSLGATYDHYVERVEQSAPALGLPTAVFHFASAVYRVGLSWKPDPQTKILLDYESSQLKGNSTSINSRPLMLGAERKVRSVALRIGSFDGKLTGGLGITHGRVNATYGFSGAYDRLLPGQGAKTAHAIQVVIEF